MNKLLNLAKDILDRTNDNVLGATEEKDEVVFFVKRKLAMSTLKNYAYRTDKPEWSMDEVLPKKLEAKSFFRGKKEKPVKVIELGDVEALADRNKYRPVKGGSEIAIKHQPMHTWSVGTAGLVVQYYSFGNVALVGNLYSFAQIIKKLGYPLKKHKAILTNSHVVNFDVTNPKLETIIVQPGMRHAKSVGRVLYSYPIIKGKNNLVDVALVDLNEDGALYESIKVGRIIGTSRAKKNLEVHKYGRTTGYTTGRNLHTGGFIKINFPEPAGSIQFKNLDVYTKMSDPGDSGSVIVASDDNRAVSLLFAGSSRATIGVPIEDALSAVGAFIEE